MKCITLYQPWASLIALGLKRFETRGWKTNYRGDFYIHAAKKIIPFHLLFNDLTFAQRLILMQTICEKYGDYDKMPTGQIIAKCNLTDCFKVKEAENGIAILENDISISGLEFSAGEYATGRYAWLLKDVEEIEPIVTGGKQGLWNYQEKGKI